MQTKPKTDYMEEGKSYPFVILKKILFSGKTQFVLSDINGRKMLLDAEYYTAYHLQTAQNIQCRVDKINCSGQIFLEPAHPIYEIDKTYTFIVEKISKRKNKFGENENQILLKGESGFYAYASLSLRHNFTIGQEVSAKIMRIKKAVVYAQIRDKYEEGKEQYKTKHFYPFFIEDRKKLEDGKEYFILRNQKKQKFLIDAAFYENYHLKIGTNINCLLTKYSSKFYYFLEPEHPYYKIGKSYDFEILSLEENTQRPEIKTLSIQLKDVFGEDVWLKTQKINKEDLENRQKIRCKIIGLKKGKPILAVDALN
jgi:hypothetical protein